jgi:hypothetical protein
MDGGANAGTVGKNRRRDAHNRHDGPNPNSEKVPPVPVVCSIGWRDRFARSTLRGHLFQRVEQGSIEKLFVVDRRPEVVEVWVAPAHVVPPIECVQLWEEFLGGNHLGTCNTLVFHRHLCPTTPMHWVRTHLEPSTEQNSPLPLFIATLVTLLSHNPRRLATWPLSFAML